MDAIPLTQTSLESLTTAELSRLADIHGVDIPPGLDRIFIIEELLELAAYDMEFDEDYIEEPAARFPESVVLPKQYNITFIETLVRDPLWVFVFWEIKSADRETFDKAPDFSGYLLKVSPFGRVAADEIFTVPIEPDDGARYLGFPPADDGAETLRRGYRIELLAERGNVQTVLASTVPFKLPGLSPRTEKPENRDRLPLVRLSGIDELTILRNGDRQFRKKGAAIPR